MPKLTYAGATYDCREGETVLDAFLRHGVETPFSCRSGICHVCVRRCVRGTVPARAQIGLRDRLRSHQYFLPCRCIPETDMEIVPPQDDDLYIEARVQAKEELSRDVLRLLIETSSMLDYRAGQFINVRRSDGMARSYSLASVPQHDYLLELHIKRVPGGTMSTWLCDELAVGDSLEIVGPKGDCHYVSGIGERNLLLIGTGTGIAPLAGIAREALENGHTGNIYLYHGASYRSGLYLHETLRVREADNASFHYIGCVSRERSLCAREGRADDVAFAAHGDLRGWSVYLCGHPDMVRAGQQRAMEAGATEIHSDAFASGGNGSAATDLQSTAQAATIYVDEETRARAERSRDPAPAPELWTALRNGDLLMDILIDFYGRVYADPQLAPFFHGITQQCSIEKQFLFLRQIFTGEKVYFGDRPRNAHHWMVIADALFDYREELMATCLREHGLPEPLVRRWREIEERYRPEIVKSAPCERIIDGLELPLDGFGEITLDVGTVCDGCGGEITAGGCVRYHLRLGSTYCGKCAVDGAEQ
jgi:NAD(P)H-flavin reductase/ferredoxin/truncated hemoglobin YjbI